MQFLWLRNCSRVRVDFSKGLLAIRNSSRSFVRAPALSLALLFTIALGVGSNASIYGLSLIHIYVALVRQRVVFEGDNYFRNPTLIEFIAENPIRRGSLPKNIVQVAEVLVNAGADRFALEQTLGLSLIHI